MAISKKDKKLIEEIINKNEEAVYRFYQENKKGLFNFIYRQIKNRQDAEEILQDSFLAFIEGLRDFTGESSLKTYLFAIAKNKIIDFIRKRKIKKVLFSSIPPYIVEGLKTILFNEEIEKRELAAKIKKVFNKLPNDYQLVLRLKYIEGEKVKTIAQKLSMKFKATESLIFRARQAFIKIFNALP